MPRRAKCANCYVCDKANCPMEQTGPRDHQAPATPATGTPCPDQRDVEKQARGTQPARRTNRPAAP